MKINSFITISLAISACLIQIAQAGVFDVTCLQHRPLKNPAVGSTFFDMYPALLAMELNDGLVKTTNVIACATGDKQHLSYLETQVSSFQSAKNLTVAKQVNFTVFGTYPNDTAT